MTEGRWTSEAAVHKDFLSQVLNSHLKNLTRNKQTNKAVDKVENCFHIKQDINAHSIVLAVGSLPYCALHSELQFYDCQFCTVPLAQIKL